MFDRHRHFPQVLPLVGFDIRAVHGDIERSRDGNNLARGGITRCVRSERRRNFRRLGKAGYLDCPRQFYRRRFADMPAAKQQRVSTPARRHQLECAGNIRKAVQALRHPYRARARELSVDIVNYDVRLRDNYDGRSTGVIVAVNWL